MPDGKVYFLIKVTAPLDKVSEFNDYWVKESLPVWEKHGAKHIGSFSNYVGDAQNQILRLFEVENISEWQKLQDFLEETEEGKDLRKRLAARYIREKAAEKGYLNHIMSGG